MELDQATAETVKALKTRLAFHENRLAENPDFKAAQSLRRTIDELSGGADAGGRHVRVVRHAAEVIKLMGRQPVGRVSQPVAAKAAIHHAGHPLTTPEVLAAMPTHGATIGGKNPRGNLVSILSGNDEFHSVRWRGGSAWWLKGRALPSAKEAAE